MTDARSQEFQPQHESGALEQAISTTSYVQIYKDVLDADGFSRCSTSKYPSGIEAAPEIVKHIVETKYQKLIQPSDENSQTQFLLPDGFDGERESREAVQTSVTLFNQSGIADLDLLRAAARYGGPGNTRYDRDAVDHHFRPTNEYNEYRRRENIPYHYGEAPPPPPAGKRNQYFSIDMGGEGYAYKIFQVLEASKKAGIQLTEEQSIKLGVLSGASHEWGHAVLRGAQLLGRPTLETAKDSGYIRGYEFVEPDLIQTHDEHIAEGISEIVMEEFLKKRIGLTQEQCNSFLDSYQRATRYAGEAAYALYEYASKKGFTPKEVTGLSTALLMAAYENFPDLYLWRLNNIISYHSEPYSREQIQELLKPKVSE